ncbi:MAG: AAA family ATPase [Chloroflexota bacterium]
MATIDQMEQYFSCQYLEGDWFEIRAIWPDREAGRSAQKHWHQTGSFILSDLAYLHDWNKAGWNIYIGANPRKDNKVSGDENISVCRSLFCDFDHVETLDGMSPGSMILEWIDERKLPSPTMLINSGHGIHAYWRLSEGMAPQDWRLLQQRMIAWLKSDPAIHNPERIMRLPGTLNTKSEPHLPCFIVYCDPDVRYEAETLVNILPEIKAESSAVVTPRDTSILEKRGRAILYAAKWQGVSEGGRNQAAFGHACQLLNDFVLDPADAWGIICDWNRSNNPPLDEREMRSAFQSAKTHAKQPEGNKLGRPIRTTVKAIPDITHDSVSKLSKQVEDEISGRSVNLEMADFPLWTECGQCFVPDTRTVIAGGVGGSKSLLLLQILTDFANHGIRVSVLELEKKREFHVRRLLAQCTGIADVTKPRWSRENPQRIRELLIDHREHLERMARVIHVPESRINIEQAIVWMQERAKTDRVICIDPVTILAKCNAPWKDDEKLINAADKIAATAGCSIIFVTHPAKGQGSRPDIDSLAGGAAWGRFADAVIWLEAHEIKNGKVRLCDGCGGLLGTESVGYNRTLHLLKTRSAEGQGWRLACWFDVSNGLVMRELGLLCRKHKGSNDD